VEAVDTVAAGDCFNGAFVAALDRGENVREALKFANRASAIAVMRKGAQESIPTKEEMEQSLIGK
jgi:ribokinase